VKKDSRQPKKKTPRGEEVEDICNCSGNNNAIDKGKGKNGSIVVVKAAWEGDVGTQSDVYTTEVGQEVVMAPVIRGRKVGKNIRPDAWRINWETTSSPAFASCLNRNRERNKSKSAPEKASALRV